MVTVAVEPLEVTTDLSRLPSGWQNITFLASIPLRYLYLFRVHGDEILWSMLSDYPITLEQFNREVTDLYGPGFIVDYFLGVDLGERA